jgi:4-hydroxybenzoate adenylyltransferase
MNFAADAEEYSQRMRWDENLAIIDGDRYWTHREVHGAASRAAAFLASRAVRPGDRVVLALADEGAWLAAMLGIARCGAVAVLANPELGGRELQRVLDDCRPKSVILAADAKVSVRHPDILDPVSLLAGRGGDRPAAPVDRDARDPLYIQYTSGTTGEPKGAVHCHADPWEYVRAAAGPVTGLDATDVSFSISKLYFAYGFGNSCIFPLLTGSAAVLVRHRPTPVEIGDLCERHRVTVLYGVPSAYAGTAATCRPQQFASVRVAVSAGESLQPALGERLAMLFGAPVLDQLGSTEVGHAFCSNTVRSYELGTVGQPLPPYELRITVDGRPALAGEVGELWVRGPTLLSRYFGRPQATADAVVDGWLRTGDRAALRADGRVALHGRTDDMEMVGGIKIAPQEIEAVIARVPGIDSVAVAAVPDEIGATRLVAFIVPADPTRWCHDAAAGAQAVIDTCRDQLAAFKVPRRVQVVPELPRTATGKLRRFALRQSGREGVSRDGRLEAPPASRRQQVRADSLAPPEAAHP